MEQLPIMGNLNDWLQIGMGKTANTIYTGSCSVDLSAAMLMLCFYNTYSLVYLL